MSSFTYINVVAGISIITRPVVGSGVEELLLIVLWITVLYVVQLILLHVL